MTTNDPTNRRPRSEILPEKKSTLRRPNIHRPSNNNDNKNNKNNNVNNNKNKRTMHLCKTKDAAGYVWDFIFVVYLHVFFFGGYFN